MGTATEKRGIAFLWGTLKSQAMRKNAPENNHSRLMVQIAKMQPFWRVAKPFCKCHTLSLLFIERPAYSLDRGPNGPKKMVHCTSSQGQQGLVQGQQGQDGGRVKSLVPHQVKNLQQGPSDQVKASSSTFLSTWTSSFDVWNFTVVAN